MEIVEPDRQVLLTEDEAKMLYSVIKEVYGIVVFGEIYSTNETKEHLDKIIELVEEIADASIAVKARQEKEALEMEKLNF